MNKIIIFSVIVILVVVGDIFFPRNLEIKDISFGDTTVSFDGFSLSAEAIVYNPNLYSIETEDTIYTLTLGDFESVGTAKGTLIKAKSNSTIELKNDFTWKETIDAAKAIKDNTELKISGEAKFKVLGTTFKKKFSNSMNISQEQLGINQLLDMISIA